MSNIHHKLLHGPSGCPENLRVFPFLFCNVPARASLDLLRGLAIDRGSVTGRVKKRFNWRTLGSKAHGRDTSPHSSFSRTRLRRGCCSLLTWKPPERPATHLTRPVAHATSPVESQMLRSTSSPEIGLDARIRVFLHCAPREPNTH